jgi:acyl transferase domain-containing protein/acyl carrier protein/predicted O-methyltransferase YrrM
MSGIDELNKSYPGIAIVGIACRFPGSENVDAFWKALREGRENVVSLSEEELLAAGVDPKLVQDQHYVNRMGVLAGIDLFDAEFFGMSPREAELTDPQQRLFLECAWTAMEDSGHTPDLYAGSIGVFAGTGWNSYLLFNLSSRSLLESDSGHKVLLGNDKDNLTTRVSYKLNLKGPSVTIQTGCSSSLVAASFACQSLLTYQCDLALAGGVSIAVPQAGYLYRPGGILSPDGHCRAFDAMAQGTVLGSGVGIVVLKRLQDALAEHDHIYAVIRAIAVNNDGALKPGYTAPSVDGQSRVILEAQAIAGVAPETITYVEAHGTGTRLGDPIEVAALNKAFRFGTTRQGFCALGSVKANIGHLDAAAGVAGLIKTALALEHRQIPPTINFRTANPNIDFSASPFYVNTSLIQWKHGTSPRRAGVSSFGLGGTNAHAILEEAPASPALRSESSTELLVLSAKTKDQLEHVTEQLARHLRQHPELSLADVAYTLKVGRKAFKHRRYFVCSSIVEALAALEGQNAGAFHSRMTNAADLPIAFMFPGQGSESLNMARGLYESEPSFRASIDKCLEILSLQHGLDLLHTLYPDQACLSEGAERIKQTEFAQPALFIVEYAMSRMWMSYGITMRASIGYGVGEYVSATLAGVFSLEDAISLVLMRGRLSNSVPNEAALTIPVPREEALSFMRPGLSLLAINEPSSCIVSGSDALIAALQSELGRNGVPFQHLRRTPVFHAQLMGPILEAFTVCLARVGFQNPSIPFVSTITGTWITSAEATDPRYWVRNLCETVNFADGVRTLLVSDYALLEVGPGETLNKLAGLHPNRKPDQLVQATLGHTNDGQQDVSVFLESLGQLWLAGVRIDWLENARNLQLSRIRLPTYPFSGQRYWQTPDATLGHAPSFQDSWSLLLDVVKTHSIAGVEGIDMSVYLKNRRIVDDLCAYYLNLALRRLGAFGISTESYSVEALIRSCKIVPYYYQLFSRMLQDLVGSGQIRQEGTSFTNLAPCLEDMIEITAEKARNEGIDDASLALIQCCGRALPAVLRGEQDALDQFLPLLELERRPRSSQLSIEACQIDLIRCALEQYLKLLPPRHVLRILEIGGGTGIVTRVLLPDLPPDRTEYTFTDVGKLFLLRAQKEFNAYPFVRFGTLDINKQPIQQGYDSQTYDVIVALNVLHVSKNISEALENISSLLVPNGLLLISEITQPSIEFDLTYGLLMDPVEDGNRSQGNPFLSKDQWLNALTLRGFSRVAVFPDDEILDQHVLIAQAPPSSTNFASVEKPVETTLSPSCLVKKHDVTDWFYIPSWKRTGRPATAVGAKGDIWLCFLDSSGLGNKLMDVLRHRGLILFTVTAGREFHRGSHGQFTIDPRNPAHFLAVLSEVQPNKIVHLWGMNPTQQFESSQGFDFVDFRSTLFIAQAIGNAMLTHPITINLVTMHQQDVIGEEGILPERALTLAAVKVIPLEYPNVFCRSVDVVFANLIEDERLIEQLLDEMESNSYDQVIAYRGPYRWVPSIEPVRLSPPKEAPPRLKNHGVYLITGGAGKLGLTVAKYLAMEASPKLILTRKSSRPFPNEKIRELEALGAEVFVTTADVANLSEMQAVVAQAQARFGPINGVIHSAGILGDRGIQQKTQHEVEQVLRPKVQGTVVLDTIFRDADLDMFIIFSSLSALKPGFGQVAYSAANNFIEAFAHSDAARRYRCLRCISWDVWADEGMAYDATAPLVLRRMKEEDFRERGIYPGEGIDVFRRVLGSTYCHLLVSTSDYLKANVFDFSHVYLQQRKTAELSRITHDRPNLIIPFIHPSNQTECDLAAIWQELLGMAPIGVDDNFFDLGGDSLIGTQLIGRLKMTFGVILPINTIYQHPTVRSMSSAVEDALISQSSTEKLDEALRKTERIN